MRKSFTGGGRPSLSGAPSRVRQDNMSSQGGRSSSLDRASYGSKLPVGRKSAASSSQTYRPRQSSLGRGNPSDHRRSESLSRNSFIPKSGRPSSGIGVRGRTDVPKDPRPISDKRYQSQCITNLLEFLTTNKYPHPISLKLLGSPSNKDFFQIFEFVMGHFWEDYKLGPKMQEEVPRMLKLVGYPFNMPKTYLCSVGSPHTWPHLLAALTWMIELVQIQGSMAGVIEGLMFEPTDEDFDSIPDDKIIFNYKEKTFSAFMAGADTFEEENQDLEKILLEKYHGGNIQDMIGENKRLAALIDDREKIEEKISSLKEHNNNLKQDVSSFQNYVEHVRMHNQSLATELEKKQEEMTILKSDFEKEESRLNKMQTVYERQDLKPADVERLRAEQDRLKAQVEQLEKQMADISADKWQLSMEQAKQNEKLEAEVAKYNRHAIALKLVPESAEFADGKDFRLRAGCSADVVMDFHTNVKPKLTLMKKNLAEQFRSKKKEQFSLTCDIEMMQEFLNEKKEQILQKEKELAQMEAEIGILKQRTNNEQKSVSEELRALETEVIQLEASLKQTKAENERLMEQCESTHKIYNARKVEAQSEVMTMKEKKDEMRTKVAEHVKNVKAQLVTILQQVEAADAEETKQLAQVKEASLKMRKKFGLPLTEV